MPKRTLYLHIGYHKTGTTAVQSYFWRHRKEIYAHSGYMYPEIGMAGPTHAKLALVLRDAKWWAAHDLVKARWAAGDSDPYAIEPTDSLDRLHDTLWRLVSDSSALNFVLSSECFLEWINPEKVAAFFGDLFDDIKIVIYLRRQDKWIQSVYNQLIKDRYFRYSGTIVELPQIKLMDYYDILSKWEDAFGEGSLLVRVYDGNRMRGSIVDDFLKTIGIDRTRVPVPDSRGDDVNRSLNKQGMYLVRWLNGLPVSRRTHDTLLTILRPIVERRSLSSDSSAAMVLKQKQVELMMQQYHNSNRKIAEKYFYRDDGLLFS